MSRSESISMPTAVISVRHKSNNSKNHQDILNDEDVHQVMRRCLGTKNFNITSWNLAMIPGTHGYLGQYHKLYVTCSIDGKISEEKFEFFAKTPPPRSSPQFDFATRSDIFNKEITFYENLMEHMGMGNGPKWKVDCYLGKKDVIIVLEDATLDGYVMPDKYVPFGYEECVMMVCRLAKFHSRSLILDEKLRRHQGTTIKDMYGEILEEELFPPAERNGRTIIPAGIHGACHMVDLVEDLNGVIKNRVKKRITEWSLEIPNLLRPSQKYKNVACHRDVWANNFMVKRDGYGRLEGFYIIDFQHLCYLPPAADFMLSLFLNTRRNFRGEHFEGLAKMYHDSMREELTSEGFDIDTYLNWKQFRDSCDEYKPLAIIYVTINQQIMLLDQESADKYFTRSPELLDRVLYGSGRPDLVGPIFTTVKEFRERFTENILDINEHLPDEPACL